MPVSTVAGAGLPGAAPGSATSAPSGATETQTRSGWFVGDPDSGLVRPGVTYTGDSRTRPDPLDTTSVLGGVKGAASIWERQTTTGTGTETTSIGTLEGSGQIGVGRSGIKTEVGVEATAVTYGVERETSLGHLESSVTALHGEAGASYAYNPLTGQHELEARAGGSVLGGSTELKSQYGTTTIEADVLSAEVGASASANLLKGQMKTKASAEAMLGEVEAKHTFDLWGVRFAVGGTAGIGAKAEASLDVDLSKGRIEQTLELGLGPSLGYSIGVEWVGREDDEHTNKANAPPRHETGRD